MDGRAVQHPGTVVGVHINLVAAPINRLLEQIRQTRHIEGVVPTVAGSGHIDIAA